jgi:hypothetical protein
LGSWSNTDSVRSSNGSHGVCPMSISVSRVGSPGVGIVPSV